MGHDIGVDDALASGAIPSGQPLPSKPRQKKTPQTGSLVLPPADTAEPFSIKHLNNRTLFPCEVLPRQIADFVLSVGDTVGVPADIPAVAALTLAGSAMGATRRFDFRPDWRVSPNLFTAIIGVSGSGKSPALRAVLDPVRMAQKFSHQEARFYRDIYPSLVAHAAENDLPPPRPCPRPSRYTVDNTTMEALVQTHGRNRRGLLVTADELAGWVRSMDAYRAGRGGDRQLWLRIYDGDPIAIDRKTDDSEIIISHPAISVLGGIQPSLLDMLADSQGREDGLLPRFLFCYPEGLRDDLPYRAGSIPRALARHWQQAVLGLLQLTFHGDEEPQVILPAPDVETLYAHWYDSSNLELSHPDFPPAVRPVWSKLRVTVLRVALILHQLGLVGDDQADPFLLTGETLGKAIQVAEWAKRQALAVYGGLTIDPIARQITQLLTWVAKKKTPNDKGQRTVCVREVQRGPFCRLGGATEVRKLFAAVHDRDLGSYNAEGGCLTITGGYSDGSGAAGS